MAFPHPTRLITVNGNQTVLQLQPMSDTTLHTLTIAPLPERLFENAIRFVATEYQRREPLLVSLQRGTGKTVTPDELLPALRTQWKDHMRSSFVALSAPNGTGAPTFDTATTTTTTTLSGQLPGPRALPKTETIMGVCLCRPFLGSPFRLATPSSSNSIFLLYDQLLSVSAQMVEKEDTREPASVTLAGDEETNSAVPPPKLACLEIAMLAVDPYVANRCVASGLLSRALAYAQASQYRTVRVACSNHFLYKALTRFGFSSERTLVLAPEGQDSQLDLTESNTKPFPLESEDKVEGNEEEKLVSLNSKEVLWKTKRCMSVVYPHTHLRLMRLTLAK